MTHQTLPDSIQTPESPKCAEGSLRILVVDDEANIRVTLQMCLEAFGHAVSTASTVEHAVAAVTAGGIDLAFVDLRLGIANGIDLTTRLLALQSNIKIILITAYGSIESAVESMRRGAVNYLCKPFTPAQVRVLVDEVRELCTLERRVAENQNVLGTAGVERELQSSNAMLQMAVERARHVAPSNACVLIRGEAGTGKNVLARAMHGWSLRVGRHFQKIDCATDMQEQIAAQIFDDAAAPHLADPLVKQCDGGTLYLAHVEHLSAPAQIKLLRLIQEGAFETHSTSGSDRVDIRIIASTCTDLTVAQSEGGFRSDLLAALESIEIVLPPLRDRPDDIPAIAQRILMYIRRTTGRTLLGFTDEAIALMKSYDWPGNLHELRQVVEQAAAEGEASDVKLKCLPERMLQRAGATNDRPPKIGDLVPLRVIEESHIRAVLSSTQSQQKAAAILGLDYQALYRRRKQYGI